MRHLPAALCLLACACTSSVQHDLQHRLLAERQALEAARIAQEQTEAALRAAEAVVNRAQVPAEVFDTLAEGVQTLQAALVRHIEGEEYPEIAGIVEAARDTFSMAQSMARQCGASERPALAGLALADTLDGWAALEEAQRLRGFIAERGLAAAFEPELARLDRALVTLLASAGGEGPVEHLAAAARLLLLVERGQVQRAQPELAEALAAARAAGRDDEPLHALVRTRADRFDDPAALASALGGVDEPGGSRLDAATRGWLLQRAAWGRHDAGVIDEALALYAQAAASFARAEGVDPLASEWSMLTARADCLFAIGEIHNARALDAVAASAPRETLVAELAAAEAALGEALELLPENEPTAAALALTGDIYYRAGDMEGIREFFGRVAARFDVAEWWNNHAFFCRETGLYEQSYASYRRCIALAPDNARWLNDTGLILLYHLDRDLDEAQALFERSAELAGKALANPFASDEVRADHVSTLGDALLNLAQLHARAGDLPRAAGYVDELIELSPERPDAQLLSAQIHHALSTSVSEPPEDEP